MQVELTLTHRMLKAMGDEWEAVAVRAPNDGEFFISASGGRIMNGNFKDSGPRVIVRRKWTWPDWIKDGMWLAMNANGIWFLYQNKPKADTSVWLPSQGLCSRLVGEIYEWTPPPKPADWRKSLMQKGGDQ